jgi:hypothetical protein
MNACRIDDMVIWLVEYYFIASSESGKVMTGDGESVFCFDLIHMHRTAIFSIKESIRKALCNKLNIDPYHYFLPSGIEFNRFQILDRIPGLLSPAFDGKYGWIDLDAFSKLFGEGTYYSHGFNAVNECTGKDSTIYVLLEQLDISEKLEDLRND